MFKFFSHYEHLWEINDFDEIRQNNKVHFTKWFNTKKPLKYNFLNDYSQSDQLEKLIQNKIIIRFNI